MALPDHIERLATELRADLDSIGDRLIGRVREVIEEESADGQQSLQSGDVAQLVDVARRIANVRKIRRNYFSAELFHERAWDMLLELYINHCTNRDMWVKDLLSAADGSPTTAMRWLDHLESVGLINRRGDEEDRRRVIVSLTHKGETAMTAFLQEAGTTS